MTGGPSQRSASDDQLTAIVEFTRQIEERDVTIAAQPIVDLARAQVVGYECLARFPETHGLPVDAWFALADRTGLGAHLEAVAIARALELRPDLPPNCFLTVNVSPAALLSSVVRHAFTRADSLAGVVVELTEHARVDRFHDIVAALDHLRGAGAMVAVDDAGAGYAGLRHIIEVRPDLLKLDRSLVSGIDRDETKRALVSMLGVFADRVDAWILAEGVETEAELAAVVDLGVPLGQGWALARPAPPWADLAPEVMAAVRAQAARRSDGCDEPTAATLMDVVAWMPATDFDIGSPPATEVVLLDAHGRPVVLLDPEDSFSSLGGRPLRIHADSPVTVVMRRMITRAKAVRSDPGIVVDAAGRYLGVIRPERVIGHLVDRVTR